MAEIPPVFIDMTTDVTHPSPPAEMPKLAPDERKTNFKQIELGFGEDEAVRGAELCLQCYCPASGKCDLQRYGIEYEVFKNRFHGGDAHDYPADFRHDFIMREPNRCINCGRCVRVCRMEVGSSCYDNMGRGFDTIVSTADNLPLQLVGCVSCGKCAETCPTGSIETNPRILGSYDLDESRCIFCGECVEVCPYDALEQTDFFELAGYSRTSMARESLYVRENRPVGHAARDRQGPRAARARRRARPGLGLGADQGRPHPARRPGGAGLMPGGDFHPWFFVIVAAWVLVCGLGVVLFKKIMYSAVSMVFCFLGVAFAYALLNAPLVAIIQILVYVGAISIVIIFAIMLTEVQSGKMRAVLQPPDGRRRGGGAGRRRGARRGGAVRGHRAHRRQVADAGPAPALAAHLRPLRVPVRARLAGARRGDDRRHRAGHAREGAPVNALYWWLLLAFLLFCIGAFGVLARRNIILVVMSLEIMLNAVNIALVATANFRGGAPGRGHAVRPVHHRAGRGRGHRRPGHRHRQLPQQAHRADRHLRRAQGLTGATWRGPHYMKIAVALIPLLPLLGFIVTLVFGKRWGSRAHILPVGLVTGLGHRSASTASSGRSRTRTRRSSGTPSPGSPPAGYSVPWGFQVDTLTGVMLLVVGVIGMLVHYYSIGYMHGDEGYYRFFAYLNLFMFAMFMLILADSYLLLFLGWEGVGLCSYLLISFWFRKKSASQAGKKAFIVNRVGDFGFTLAMFAHPRRHRHAAVHRRVRGGARTATSPPAP